MKGIYRSQKVFKGIRPIDPSSLELPRGACFVRKRSLLAVNEHCERARNKAGSQNAKGISGKELRFRIPTAPAMLAFGNKSASAWLAAGNPLPYCYHLQGELGAGKTTWVRGFLQGLGYKGLVKSPTYTIVEPYVISGITVYHYDLYRLSDPKELDYIGIHDYLNEKAIFIFEWPERGGDLIPKVDLLLTFKAAPTDADKRIVDLVAESFKGCSILKFFT